MVEVRGLRMFSRNRSMVVGWKKKITASDGSTRDTFGSAVAISGNTIVVGAPKDDDNGVNSGSAYVFTRQADGRWTEEKLTASDGAQIDDFGASVAISGNTVVVGAWGDDDNGEQSGSAYIFTRQADGSWTEQKLMASDGSDDHRFGWDVAISGHVIVVGAYRHSPNPRGHRPGAAYIFTRQGDGRWTEDMITAFDGRPLEYFGMAVALSGTQLW